MSSILSAPHFHDEAAAYAHVEARVWPDGRVCPHCGVIDRSGLLKGKSNRIGLYKCYACRKPFSVKVGTVMEASHIPMHVWLQAMHLMASSKKGISANQLHRTLGITLKSAWFLAHRIREAMSEGYQRRSGQMGGPGAVIEADETMIGPNPSKDSRVQRHTTQGSREHLVPVYSLVERGGEVRSFPIKRADSLTLLGILQDQVNRHSGIHTDKARVYYGAHRVFLGGHRTVDHSRSEYVRGDVHTNVVENFFSILKRGIFGVYQHVSPKHLGRYLAEYDFRYNQRIALGINDEQRADKALRGISGKRLTYANPHSRRAIETPPF
jgi:transposase-like protein